MGRWGFKLNGEDMTNVSEREAELLSRIADPAVKELFELQKGWIYSELTFLMELIRERIKASKGDSL